MSTLQCAARLVLARHGEAAYEAAVWADEGGSLTPTGRRQAADLAERLAGRRIAHVWTSTLARAVQTGEIAAARLGVGVTTRQALSEFACADLAGAPLAEDPFAPTYGAWLDGELDTRIPGGESGAEVIARMREVLAEIADAHPGESALVISHGGALRLAVPALFRLESGPGRLANCGTIEAEIDADDWVCRVWAGDQE